VARGLIAGLGARKEKRAVVGVVAAGAAGLMGSIAWGGFSGVRQVLTYRDARGWEFESVPGSLLRLVTRYPLRLESGAWRLGAPPSGFAALLVLLAVALIAAIWWHAARHDVRAGVAEVATIASLLVTGTLLSPQFIAWMLPCVAIAAAAGAARIERWAAGVVALTFLEWTAFDVDHTGKLVTEMAVIARNVALVGLLVVAVAELRTQGPALVSSRRENRGSAAPVAVG
jgi:hypothetical protein